MDFTSHVVRAQQGDRRAFDALTVQFQDMAFGYAYALTQAFELAQDMTQEAFVEAFRTIGQLSQPAAWPSRLRLLVFKHYDRIRRRGALNVTPIDEARMTPDGHLLPDEVLDGKRKQAAIAAAMTRLTGEERTIIALFYTGNYTRREIAEFLDVSTVTVKNRLHSARRKMKETLLQMAADTLKEEAPSQDEHRARKIRFSTACRTGDLDTAAALLKEDGDLARFDIIHPSLHYAARSGYTDLVRLLLDHGADPQHAAHHPTLEISAARGYDEIVQMLNTAFEGQKNIQPGGELIGQAIRQRDFETAKAVIQENPDLVHAADEQGLTPLHWAVGGTGWADGGDHHDVELIDFLLDHGADIHAADLVGMKPLHYTIWSGCWGTRGRWALTGYLLAKGAEMTIPIAAALGDIARVQAYLHEDPTLADYPDSCEKRPLSTAVEFGHTDIVKLLLDHGADPNAHEHPCSGGYALWKAARDNNLVCARLLLEHGANLFDEVYAAGSPCWIAEDEGHRDMGTLLNEFGGNCEFPRIFQIDDLQKLEAMLQTDPARATAVIGPLFGSSSLDAVKMALQYGADAAVFGMWDIWRIWLFRPHVMKTLADRGMDVNAASEPTGQNCLHWAARDGKIRLAALLLECGADIHLRDVDYHATPLTFAAREGHALMAQFLLDHGAKPELPDDEPWSTPMFWAEQRGHEEVIEVLNHHHRPNLYAAAVLGRVDDVDRFLREGADPDTRNPSGASALQAAARRGRREICNLLLDHGAVNDLDFLDSVSGGQAERAADLLKTSPHLVQESRRSDGGTALHLAAHYGYDEMVEMLLGAGAGVDAEAGDGDTPLVLGALQGGKAVCERLIEAGASKKYLDDAGKQGMPPLYRAIERNLPDGIFCLLELGVDPEGGDKHGPPPLHRLHLDLDQGETVMDALVNHGADVNAVYNGRTVLDRMKERSVLSLIEPLQRHGATYSGRLFQ